MCFHYFFLSAETPEKQKSSDSVRRMDESCEMEEGEVVCDTTAEIQAEESIPKRRAYRIIKRPQRYLNNVNNFENM